MQIQKSNNTIQKSIGPGSTPFIRESVLPQNIFLHQSMSIETHPLYNILYIPNYL